MVSCEPDSPFGLGENTAIIVENTALVALVPLTFQGHCVRCQASGALKGVATRLAERLLE